MNYMNYFILFLFCTVAAEWPPASCTSPAGVKNGVVVLTGPHINNVQTECMLEDVFDSNFYLKFKRVYTSDFSTPSDSTMSISFKFAGRTRFSLEIHNDRMKMVADEKEEGIMTDHRECLSVLARNDNSFEYWVRFRINHLRELQRTFISVALTSYDGTSFVPCIRLEMPIFATKFGIQLLGHTTSFMRQEVHVVTSVRPVLLPSTTSVNTGVANQLRRLETRVGRMQQALQRYMSYHDEHVSQTGSDVNTLKIKVQNTNNRFESRTDNYLGVGVFAFFLIGIGVCAYISWKFQKEKRFHLL